MRRPQKVLFSLAGSMALLAGRDAIPPKTGLPTAMQKAIDQLAKGPALRNSLIIDRSGPERRQCSVPLLEVPVDKTHHYTMRLLSPREPIPVRRVEPPAPPCK